MLRFLINCERRPELAMTKLRGKIELLGHHADDSERSSIDRHRLAHNVGIGVEAAHPKTMPEHYHLIAPGLIFSLLHGPAESGLYADGVEEIGGHGMSPYLFRFMRSCYISQFTVVTDELL